MRYRYQRWVLRIFTLIALGTSAFLVLQSAVQLYKVGLRVLTPWWIIGLAMWTYFLLGVKIADLGPSGEPTTSLYGAVRGDFIKFVAATTLTSVLVILWR